MFHLELPWRRKSLERETPAWASSLMDFQVDSWVSENLESGFFSPRLIEKVWVATRCIQLNAQQIAAMPLRFQGAFENSVEPVWLASPDPVWYPNGIGDAVFSAIRSIYGWGDAFLFVTSRYANGFPQSWTVLDPSLVEVEFDTKNGRKKYTVNGEEINRDNVVQISRDPGAGLRGTSALKAYAAQAWSILAAGKAETDVNAGGTIPAAVLKSSRKLTPEQAASIKQAWVAARAGAGRGVPAILPPDLELLEGINIDPKDLMLLDSHEFDARVIASAFGVPSFLLNIPPTGSLVYQNPAALGEFWWRFELRTTAKRFADALTANMLPRGNAVVFDASDTFAPLTEEENMDDSQVAGASPADENVRPLRPMEEVRA